MLIHPFDHVDIVAGQGTLGLEILEQVPDVQTVLVPTGGGGLLAGVAIAVKALRPDVRVVGVQAAGRRGVPGLARAGRAGRRWTSMKTMADGIAVGLPGRRSRSPRCATTSTRSSPSPRSRCRGRCWRCSSGPRWSSSRPARPRVAALLDTPHDFETPGGRGALRRQHRPAAAGQGDPARHGRRRPLPQPAGHASPTARAAWPGCSPRSARRRQRARGRARADLAARCTSTRSRCSCSSRPAAPQHAEQVLDPAAASGGYRRHRSRPTRLARRGGSAGVGHRVDDLDLELLAVGSLVGRRCRPCLCR